MHPDLLQQISHWLAAAHVDGHTIGIVGAFVAGFFAHRQLSRWFALFRAVRKVHKRGRLI